MTVKRKTLVANFEARSVLLIAGWTLGVASTAMAQNMPARPAAPSDAEISATFKQADKNGDGQLSREEATAVQGLEAAFDRLDTDRSGSLSPEEFDRRTQG
ncbi:MAG: EF-hand domain-containing protein [Hydrogenophaga sp.]|jgi:hypothetical protein|nr:EF-hand domain-containing protein [Hydrogenophaga sp.]